MCIFECVQVCTYVVFGCAWMYGWEGAVVFALSLHICMCALLIHLFVCVCVSLYVSTALVKEVARLLLTDDK